MATRQSEAASTADREMVVRRVIDAPRKLVFEAWTDPKHLERWWGPRGFSTTTHEFNFAPGGTWQHVMHGPDGVDYPNHITFKEIEKPSKIMYTNTGGKDGDETGFVATVTFVEQGGKTEVTMRAIFPTVAERDRVIKEYGALEGGKQTLERLEEHLATMAVEREFVVERVIKAPRELVWKVWTNPEHMMQWWGPKGFICVSGKMDLRPAGMFHYCLRSPDGHDIWGKFVYREIFAPERLIFVDSFSDEKEGTTRHPMAPGWPLEILNTLTLTENYGKTTLVLRGAPISATDEERKAFDAGFASLNQGFKGTLDQLDEYLEKIQAEVSGRM